MRAVTENWALVSAVFANLLTLAGIAKYMKNTLSDEVHKGITLSLANGGGEQVERIVLAAVGQGLMQHQIACPLKDRIDDTLRRVVRLEDE